MIISQVSPNLSHASPTSAPCRATLRTMKRLALNLGTRDEIRAELDQYGSDRAQQGKPDKAREFARALADLEAGADEVRAGHAVYRVVEK